MYVGTHVYTDQYVMCVHFRHEMGLVSGRRVIIGHALSYATSV